MFRFWLLAIVAWVGFVSATAQAQVYRSQFGQKWPTVRECLEFSDETGFWVSRSRRTLELTGGAKVKEVWPQVLYKFNKDSTFHITWTHAPHTAENRFGRKITTAEKVVRRGTWATEYRVPTARERAMFDVPASSDIKMNFLTLVFAGNEKSKFERDNNLDPNGTMLLVLYEHQKPGTSPSASTLKSFTWFYIDTHKCGYSELDGVTEQGRFTYREMTHY